MSTARRAASSITGLWLGGMLGFAQLLASDEEGYRRFDERNRCTVLEILHNIRAAPGNETSHNRFLAISFEREREGYVQCIFFDKDRQVHCEAASGFFSSKPGEPARWAPDAEALAALGKLGFDTSIRDGNYPAELDVTGPTGLAVVADLQLKAMFEAYRARAFDTLKFVAPLGGSGVALSRCRPAS